MKGDTITGILVILFGAAVIASEGASITGAFAGAAEPSSFLLMLLGTLIALLGMLVLTRKPALEHKVMLTSAIKKDEPLLRLTREAVRDQYVAKDINHLTQELAKGHLQAGIGLRHIDETDVKYLRSRRGGRLYFREVGPEHYEIVAKSAKGPNQDRVMERLRGIYRRLPHRNLCSLCL